MSNWDDIDKYEKTNHERLLKYIKIKHEYKMKELEKEVGLYTLRERVKK